MEITIIQSLDCKNLDNNDWSLMVNSGQNKYNNYYKYCQKLIDSGAGEILINSIDNDEVY